MTEKELYKLHRPDLLQLLLTQGREAADLQTKLTGSSETLAETQDVLERLKGKLDDKDVLIRRLRIHLDEKDEMIRKQQEELDELRINNRLQLEFIEEAALRFNEIFDVAHQTVEQYLHTLRQMCGICVTDILETNKRSVPSREVFLEENADE